MDNIRASGNDIVGDIPCGTHFCLFYRTKEDLIDVLVPYFKAGLDNNEFCIWIIPESLSLEETKKSLEKGHSRF
ncbi:MEDS domain-containing protein [Methanosarcina horonobensis]|uniref:MEDS domain-containing protein n=1 Tax=Methanosarcina horonobensis TaxID=418008 RepID=UPI000A7CD734|nr:MEDS domain-containing protein [Methanosarcina horonobensis]